MRRRIAALTLVAAGLVLIPATAAQAVYNPPVFRQSFYGPTAMTDCTTTGRYDRDVLGLFDQFQCIAGQPGTGLVTLLGYAAP
jgi:hypothetical protein